MFPLAVLHADSGSFFPAVMAVFLPIMAMYLLHKSVMGDIGCLTAILMLGTGIFLLAVIWAIKDPFSHWMAVIGIVTLTVGVPILNVVTDKLQEKFAEADEINVCYQHIRMNPQNAMAGFRLATLLYKRGETDTAVAIARGVLPHLPASAFRDEHRLFVSWTRKANPNASTEINCVACGKDATRGALICPHCLGSLHLERARKFSVVHNSNFRKIVTVYATLLIILISIPILGQLSPLVSVPAILILLVIAVFAVSAAFGFGLRKQ